MRNSYFTWSLQSSIRRQVNDCYCKTNPSILMATAGLKISSGQDNEGRVGNGL